MENTKSAKHPSAYKIISAIIIVILAILFTIPAVLDHHRILQDERSDQLHHPDLVADGVDTCKLSEAIQPSDGTIIISSISRSAA